MSRCRNSFLRSLDTDKNLGIGALMRRVDDIVRSSDPELWQRLADQSVVPEYYSFRWLTTLCAREFELPGVLRLWDSVLADHEFLTAFCAAMVL
ncbi:MAG: hypothetical protein BJ554DRAFT_2343 [Olpidium bornovanus]|uniref:Rab-GAP TBC domain-containing protein n=1 Tax=Olpidium bornovanus TaxID=278681 RepID=A0A8H7ZQD6_9FUNG|nr:MAG: hypothetical protein BJ554DRAFT_2343 [Olpidium bornovanus]